MGRDLLLFGDTVWKFDRQFNFTGEPQSFTLTPGKYLIECNGAQGGKVRNMDKGMSGGQTMGIINVESDMTLYAIVGGNGEDTTIYEGRHPERDAEQTSGGYNGGGNGGIANCTHYSDTVEIDNWVRVGASGGGATDIRLNIEPDSIVEITKTLPSQYNPLKYLIGDYSVTPNSFDTEYILNHNSSVIIDACMISDTLTNYSYGVFMCDEVTWVDHIYPEEGESYDLYHYMGFTSHMKSYPGSSSSSTRSNPCTLPSPVTADLLNRRTITTIDDRISIYDFNTGETKESDVKCIRSIDHDWPSFTIFGIKYRLNNVDAYKTGTPMKLYSFTIREDGTDVHKYIPVVDTTTNKTGLYDLCTDEFHEYDVPSINDFEIPNDIDEMVDGVQFKCEDGIYTIKGAPGESITYTFNLRRSYTVPTSYASDQNDGSILKICNNGVQGAHVAFCNGNTVVKEYTYITFGIFTDTEFSGLENQTVNNIKVTLQPTVGYEFSFGIMFTKLYPNQDLPSYQSPDYKKPITTRTFTINKHQLNSLNSRIMVACGGGAGRNSGAGTTVGTPTLYSSGGSHNDDGNVYATQTSGGLFGRALRPTNSNSKFENLSPMYGAGGGWYGGISGIYTNTMSGDSMESCGSGSSYILTESSYKPDGYMNGYNISTYYFEHPYMSYITKQPSCVRIYKPVNIIQPDDLIKTFCHGRSEKITLNAGEYLLVCNGASGGVRDDDPINYSPTSGGRATGVLSRNDYTTLYLTVGGSAQHIRNATNISIPANDDSNAISFEYVNQFLPYLGYNGGGKPNTLRSACARILAMYGGGATDIRLSIPERRIDHLSIPDEYTELEYLETVNNSNSYINTGYTHKWTTNVECVCYATLDTNNSYRSPFGARYTSSSRNFGFYTRYSGYNKGTIAFGSSNTRGDDFTYDQKVTIKMIGATAEWYNENDELLGSAVSTSTPTNGDREMRLFDFNYSDTTSASAPFTGRIYSFKISEVDTLKMYLLPCKHKETGVCGMYDLITNQFHEGLKYSSSAPGFIEGPEIPDENKTVFVYDRITPIEDSMLSRILVAAGSSGSGKSIGVNGGGESGIAANGSNGTNYGPGTQTGTGTSSSYIEIQGGFGYGGNGNIYSTNGHGGAGGGGWYGGCGTEPGTNSDSCKSGASGSGYVLTADSVKPTGYTPDETYYLSNPTNITGGAALEEPGFETASIEALNVYYYKIIVQDGEGYKAYDAVNDIWNIIPGITELTQAVFNQYGVYSYASENGLTSTDYDVLAYDPDSSLEKIIIDALPQEQTITTTITSPNMFDSVTTDTDDFDIPFIVDMYNYDDKTRISIIIDMYEVPEKTPKMYNISMTSERNRQYIPPEHPEKKYLPHVDLLTVGQNYKIPTKYNDYIEPYLSDRTVINEINYIKIFEQDRLLHVLMQVNHKTPTSSTPAEGVLRYSTFNLITREIQTVFEIPMTKIESVVSTPGDFIVTDDYVYISSGWTSSNSLIRVNKNDPGDISTLTPTGDYIGNESCRGTIIQMNDEMILLTRSRSIVYYNIRLRETSYIYQIPSSTYYDCAYNDNYIVMTRGSTKIIVAFNRITNTYTEINGPLSSNKAAVCYGDGMFYVVQYNSSGSNIIAIYDGETMNLAGTVSIPITNKNPDSINYSDGVLYMTMDGMFYVYMCELYVDPTDDLYKIKSFRSVAAPKVFTNTLNPSSASTQKIRCTAFKQYFFVPDYQLFTINYRYAKYNLGYKYNHVIYELNESTSEQFVYDSRFVTFEPTYMTIHPGELEYLPSEHIGDITKVHISTYYMKLLKIRLYRKEEDENGQ